MSETILDNLLKRRSDLQKELSELEKLIDFYESQTRNRKIFRSDAVVQHRDIKASNALKSKSKNRGLPTRIASAVYDILSINNRPMTRGELADQLQRNGMSLPSTDPAKYVGTILWRHSHMFVNLEGEGYWIKGVSRK